jgi:hypothetical protein
VLVMLFIPKTEDCSQAGRARHGARHVGGGHLHAHPVQLRQGGEAAVLPEHLDQRRSRATYTIGLDGISLPLYFLSMVITVLVMIYSWNHIPSPATPRRSSS